MKFYDTNSIYVGFHHLLKIFILFLVAMTKSRAIVVTFYNEKKDDWTFFLMLCPPESSALAQTHQMLRTNSWMFTDVASVKMARQVQHEEVNIMMIQKYTSVLPELI